MSVDLRRLGRFAGVGLAGYLTQAAVLFLLVALPGVHYVVATALAVEAAILQNFAWHEAWTWRDRVSGSAGRLGRLARFNGTTALVSIVGNAALTMVFVEGLHLPVIAANAMAVLILSTVNLVAADRWVFRATAPSSTYRPTTGSRCRPSW